MRDCALHNVVMGMSTMLVISNSNLHYFNFRVKNITYKCTMVIKASSTHKSVNNNHCLNIPKPPEQKPCQGACESTRWRYYNWTEVRIFINLSNYSQILSNYSAPKVVEVALEND